MLVKLVGGLTWCIRRVYVPQRDVDKMAFLEELVEVRDLHAGSWTTVGDFNLLVNQEDKKNNAVSQRMMAHFRALLNRLELKEIYLNDRK